MILFFQEYDLSVMLISAQGHCKEHLIDLDPTKCALKEFALAKQLF
jgi:hypothetical protein